MRPRVLIADSENWDSLAEIPYLFRCAGCDADMFCSRDSWLLTNSCYASWHHAPASDAAYMAALAACAQAGQYDWIVPGDDKTVRRIAEAARQGDVFAQSIVPVRNAAMLPVLGSKAVLSEACQAHGIRTPAFFVVREGNSIEPALEALSFPIVMKIDESAGGTGVFFCATPDAARRKHQELSGHGTLLFQEYISGDNIAVESLFRDGVLVLHASAKVTRTLGGEFGISSEREYFFSDHVRTLVKEIGKTFGIHGFASMTFMRIGDDYFLIEADMRPQAWYAPARHAGVDFSCGIQNFLRGKTEDVFLPDGKNKTLRLFPRDVIRAFHERDRSGMFGWIFLRDGRVRALPWHDPIQFFVVCVRGCRYVLRRAGRKIGLV